MKPVFLQFLLLGLLGFGAARTFAQQEWETLSDCRLVPAFSNDADSFLVSHKGRRFVVRLFFVDAPETSLLFPDRVKEQAAYFQISQKATQSLAATASEFTKRFLAGGFTVHTRWEDAYGKQKRYRAIIEKDAGQLCLQLAENGLVRLHGFEPEGRWPGGSSTSAMKGRLAGAEKRAKMAGLGGWGSGRPRMPEKPASSPVADGTNDDVDGRIEGTNTSSDSLTRNRYLERVDGKVNLDFASRSVLESLPGVGPTLAERIELNRPYPNVEGLKNVAGIGQATLEKLSPLVTVEAPEPGLETADFYRKNPAQWRNRKVMISIGTIEETDLPAPEGYVLIGADTVSVGRDGKGNDGGSIPLFVPDERIDRIRDFFAKQPLDPVRTKALFYHYNETDVLVIPR